MLKDCLLLLATLTTLAPPVFAPTADRILGFSARVMLRISLPALLLLGVIFVYTLLKRHGLSRLILWGLIGGLLGTVALNAVRLAGVQVGAFPMDMPRMFGIIAAGKAPQFQTNTMATIVQSTADLPDEQLREVMRKRLKFLAGLDETSRRAFMGAMLKGLMALPADKRARMVETQMALITSELDPDAARTVSDSMSTIMSGTPPPEKFPSGIELFHNVPQVPMREFRRATETSYPLTLQESGFSDRWVAALGYLWHFNIGATFGITYTLLFGRGSWPLAFGWGLRLARHDGADARHDADDRFPLVVRDRALGGAHGDGRPHRLGAPALCGWGGRWQEFPWTPQGGAKGATTGRGRFEAVEAVCTRSYLQRRATHGP